MVDIIEYGYVQTESSSAPAHLTHPASPLTRFHVRVRLKINMLDGINISTMSLLISTSCLNQINFKLIYFLTEENGGGKILPRGQAAHQRAGLVSPLAAIWPHFNLNL